MQKTAIIYALLATLVPAPLWAAAPSDPRVERIAPNRLRVTWSDPNGVDVYQSDRADATRQEARLISADDRDGSHELDVAPDERTYLLLRDRKDGKKVRVAERLLPLERGSNFRDIGGYPAAGGRHVRWGMIYRSGASPQLTVQDLKMIEGLHLASLVDLRSSEERQMSPTKIDGVPYNAVGYPMRGLIDITAKADRKGPTEDDAALMYRNMPTFLAPQFRILFQRLLSGEGPVAFNCSAGQDRTGLATALILSALGVPRDVILADYHLSTAYRRPEFEYAPGNVPTAAAKAQPLKMSDGKPFLAFAFESIDERFGSVDGYLDKELGLNAVAVAALRGRYLE